MRSSRPIQSAHRTLPSHCRQLAQQPPAPSVADAIYQRSAARSLWLPFSLSLPYSAALPLSRCTDAQSGVLIVFNSKNLGSSKLPNCPASSQPFNWKHKKLLCYPLQRRRNEGSLSEIRLAVLRFLFFTFVDSHHSRSKKFEKKTRKTKKKNRRTSAVPCTVVHTRSVQTIGKSKFRKATSVSVRLCVEQLLWISLRLGSRTLKKSNRKVFCCAPSAGNAKSDCNLGGF